MAENKNDSTTLVNFRVDAVVKDSAEAVLAGMGLSVSAYVGMCLRKLAQDKGVPFDLRVDPKFWSAEAEVSKVMSSIESGAFIDAVKVRNDVNVKLVEEYSSALDKSEHAHHLMGLETFIDGESLFALYRSLRLLEKEADGKGGDAFREMCGNVADYLATRAAEFCERNGISVEDSRARQSGFTDEEAAVNELSGVLTNAVDAYDKHGEQLMMRFVSPKADEEALVDIVDLSEIRKVEKGRNKDKERKKAAKRAAKIDLYKEMKADGE